MDCTLDEALEETSEAVPKYLDVGKAVDDSVEED